MGNFRIKVVRAWGLKVIKDYETVSTEELCKLEGIKAKVADIHSTEDFFYFSFRSHGR